MTEENGACHVTGREEQERLRRARESTGPSPSGILGAKKGRQGHVCGAADGPADMGAEHWPLDLARTH